MQDCAHQCAQGAGEILFTDQDCAGTGVDDIDRAARGRVVSRRDGQDLLDQVLPVPGVRQADGLQRATADAPVPADLGDHDPHLYRSPSRRAAGPDGNGGGSVPGTGRAPGLPVAPPAVGPLQRPPQRLLGGRTFQPTAVTRIDPARERRDCPGDSERVVPIDQQGRRAAHPVPGRFVRTSDHQPHPHRRQARQRLGQPLLQQRDVRAAGHRQYRQLYQATPWWSGVRGRLPKPTVGIPVRWKVKR